MARLVRLSMSVPESRMWKSGFPRWCEPWPQICIVLSLINVELNGMELKERECWISLAKPPGTLSPSRK